MFEAWQLGFIDEAGYNGIRDEHIHKIAMSLLSVGLTEIDRATFENHCIKNGVDPRNFDSSDLERLQDMLNN